MKDEILVIASAVIVLARVQRKLNFAATAFCSCDAYNTVIFTWFRKI